MAVNSNSVLSGGVANSIPKTVSTAKTDYTIIASPSDGADLALVFTADTYGGFVDAIDYQLTPIGATNSTQAASIMNIWMTNESGLNARVIKSVAILAMSATSTTTPGVYTQTALNFYNIQAGCKLFVSFTVVSANGNFNVVAWSGQFSKQA